MAEVRFPYRIETSICVSSPNAIRAFEWCHTNIGLSSFYRNTQGVIDGAWMYDVDLDKFGQPLTFSFHNAEAAIFFKLWMQGLKADDNFCENDWRKRWRTAAVSTPGGPVLGFKPGQLHIMMSTGRKSP